MNLSPPSIGRPVSLLPLAVDARAARPAVRVGLAPLSCESRSHPMITVPFNTRRFGVAAAPRVLSSTPPMIEVTPTSTVHSSGTPDLQAAHHREDLDHGPVAGDVRLPEIEVYRRP